MSGILSILISTAGGPLPPKNLVAGTYTTTGFTLTWNYDPKVTSYQVAVGAAKTLISGLTFTSDGSTYNSTVINTSTYTENTSFNFYVKAINASGFAYSTALAVYSNPAAPTGLSVTSISSIACVLSWTGVTGITYTIWNNTTKITGITPSATGTTVSNLDSNRTYNFLVKAENSTQIQVASSALPVTTLAAVPVATTLQTQTENVTLNVPFSYNQTYAVNAVTYRVTAVNNSNSTSTPLTGTAVSFSMPLGATSVSNGVFSTSSGVVANGNAIYVTGTNSGTGSISGYASGTTYYAISSNGYNTFSLSTTIGGTAVTTTNGTFTGLTFVNNNGYYFKATGLTINGYYSFYVATITTVGTSSNSNVSGYAYARELITFNHVGASGTNYVFNNTFVGYTGSASATVIINLSGTYIGTQATNTTNSTHDCVTISLSLGTGATLTVNNNTTITGYTGFQSGTASVRNTHLAGGYAVVINTPCTFINNSTIQGGPGGGGSSYYAGGVRGGDGGHGIRLATTATIINYGGIRGGGSGGGSSGAGGRNTFSGHVGWGGNGGSAGHALTVDSGQYAYYYAKANSHQYSGGYGGGGGGGVQNSTSKGNSGNTATGYTGGSGGSSSGAGGAGGSAGQPGQPGNTGTAGSGGGAAYWAGSGTVQDPYVGAPWGSGTIGLYESGTNAQFLRPI